MTTLSPNLQLVLYNNSSDQTGSFLGWTRDVSGSSNSNMTKIDAWSGSASGSIIGLSSSLSGSVAILSGSVNDMSGSIANILSAIASLQLRFIKIGEFTGAGQADFNNISGSYTHLLIFGIAATVGTNAELTIDFNGDANSANYNSYAWYRHNTGEFFSQRLSGGIVVTGVPGDNIGVTQYGGPILAIIPNYSGSGGFYKSAFGISFETGRIIPRGLLGGGYWSNNSVITRIRLSATRSSGTRYDFRDGTKITLYGIG